MHSPRYRFKGPSVILFSFFIVALSIFLQLADSLSTNMSAAAAVQRQGPLAVRVVSYNVLSSQLASPSHFTKCAPEHLDAEKRLPKILSKLDEQLSSAVPPIICLQEVSYDFAGPLHTFFANKGYHLITGLYGKKFNGYMGVSIAYPIGEYETLAVDVSRLSDRRVDPGWPKEDEEQKSALIETLQMGLSAVVSIAKRHIIKPARKLLQLPPSKDRIDPWDMSRNRFNVLLTVCLRQRQHDQAFCISNYHMPCAFYAPMVMNIHAEMCVRHLQDFASKQKGGSKECGVPYILAGDFNLMPDSPHYRLITTGELSKDDPTYPEPKFGMEWKSTIRGMRSAYAVSDHGEPDFTNYAQIRDDEPFIGTLDYIFISDEWEVSSVQDIVHRDVANGPYPNDQEPSDHVVIAADLQLTK